MGKRVIAVATAVATCICFFSSSALARYSTELRHATKKGDLFSYETWDAKILWHATFFSDNFRAAYNARHIEINHLDDEETARFLHEEARDQRMGWDFFIGSYTKKEYKGFSIEPDSFWKIHITTAGGEIVKPLEIEQIIITPYERQMYPYLTRWSKAYRVSFPKVDLGNEFSLTIESVIGESTLKWKAENKEAEKQEAEK